MKYFDGHAHYDDEKFDEDREELLNDMKANNVDRIISAAYSLKSSYAGLELASKYDFIYTTVGISPNDIEYNYLEEIEEVDKILEKREAFKIDFKALDSYKYDKILAVGEIGLDYHYDTNKDYQKEAFIKQIELANKYDLPIVIHTRDAVMDTLSILKEHPVNRRGVFHCCPFNRELVKEALKLGYYISISGTSTFKNSKNASEIIGMISNDRILIETDSPYLSPEPNRGKRNDSRNLKYIVKKISEVKECSEEEIAKITFENTCKLYKIDI